MTREPMINNKKTNNKLDEKKGTIHVEGRFRIEIGRQNLAMLMEMFELKTP
jgi:hypothetical protein